MISDAVSLMASGFRPGEIIPAESMEELEELLDTDLMLPDEATGEEKVNYLLIMDPESNKISISSVPLTWKDQSIEFSSWMYNDEAPEKLIREFLESIE